MDNLITQLLNYAFEDEHIAIYMEALSPNTPCAANPEKRSIFINTNWHKPEEMAMQIAHEIGHVLNEDPGVLYYSTPSKNSLEYGASETGIRLLVPLYFDGVDPDNVNVNTFEEQLGVPPYMEPFTEKTIREFYSNL